MFSKKLYLIATSVVALAILPNTGFAAPQRLFRDLKLPSQKMTEKQTFTNPAVAGTADVLSASAGNTSAAAATVSTFVAQPDVPRSLVITPGGTTADVAACQITVNGTNINGAVMSETFGFANNQSAATPGALAFKTVTSVVFPANCEDGGFAATWSIGYGERLGVAHCMDDVGDFFFSELNGAKEATAPTLFVGTGASTAGVTVDFNGTMNGANDFKLFYMQNYRCP